MEPLHNQRRARQPNPGIKSILAAIQRLSTLPKSRDWPGGPRAHPASTATGRERRLQAAAPRRGERRWSTRQGSPLRGHCRLKAAFRYGIALCGTREMRRPPQARSLPLLAAFLRRAIAADQEPDFLLERAPAAPRRPRAARNVVHNASNVFCFSSCLSVRRRPARCLRRVSGAVTRIDLPRMIGTCRGYDTFERLRKTRANCAELGLTPPTVAFLSPITYDGVIHR
jgi:hypothetical protein